MNTAAPIRTGLLGYGTAGSVFHAPLIAAEPRLTLTAIASSRADEVRARYTGAQIHDTPTQLIDDPDIDLIVVATPDTTHASLARAALRAGKHVVIDKPMATTLDDATMLVSLAREFGRQLTVFHNRRWDGDFQTARQIVQSEQLGCIRLASFCWDRFRPKLKAGWREQSPEPWGALFNLGPHLADQALQLFGRPEAICADLALQRSGALSPDYFNITLHYGETRVQLSASTLSADPRPRFALHGTRGSFVKYGVDPQEERLRASMSATRSTLGEDPDRNHGLLTIEGAAPRRVRTLDGNWRVFYASVAAMIADGAPPPIDPSDAVEGLRLITLARRSADEGQCLQF